MMVLLFKGPFFKVFKTGPKKSKKNRNNFKKKKECDIINTCFIINEMQNMHSRVDQSLIELTLFTTGTFI
jgi:hypothetical protein